MGCKKENSTAGAPPPAKVEQEQDSEGFEVEHPDQFPLVQAGAHKAAPELSVTGVVSPDVARTVPAISLASGRAVEIKVRLGDTVSKGQLLMKVRSNDVAAAYSEYRQAVATRSCSRGSSMSGPRPSTRKGRSPRRTWRSPKRWRRRRPSSSMPPSQKLKILGVTDLKHHPSGIVDIYAPISGVIIEQNVTAGAGVKTLDNSPNLFTIANLDSIWVICDVYENNFPFVRLGEYADVRLNAYPGKTFKGRISNIGPILDPNIRTAKVRLEMPNPGLMRIGMFVDRHVLRPRGGDVCHGPRDGHPPPP